MIPVPEKRIVDLQVNIETIYCGGQISFEMNGVSQSFAVPKGLKEGVQFEIDETTIGRIVYVPNQTYRREGNDLYGTFIYSREYEGLQTEIQSLDPNETIGQITLQEGNYCIEGKGFEDTESGERGNYFVSISLM